MSTPLPLPLSPPYVKFKKWTGSLIGSTPSIICTAFNEADPPLPTTVMVDSIEFLNTTSETIKITSYILSETGSDPQSDDCDYTTVGPFERKSVILQQVLILNAGDLLYAYSDFSSSIFNSFVMGRILNELVGG